MNHFSFFGRLLLVLFITTTLSCTDHRDVPVPALRFRVKTITYGQPNFTSQPILLTYNTANRLVSYRYAGSLLLEVLKDKRVGYVDNHVAAMTGSVNKNTNYYQLYSADTQGRIIKMEYYDNLTSTRSPKLVEEFTYTGNSTTPSSRIATRSPSNGSPESKSRTELYTFSGGNATSIDGTSYTYDTSPNPYKGLFGFSASAAFDYFGTTNDATSDLNNPFSVSEPFSDMSAKVFNQNNITTDAQLTYNSDGLVTKIVYKDGNTESFTYESY